jgi:hypothetical protein
MSVDPRFGTESPDYVQVERRRSKWTTCLIGCLIVLGVIMVIVIALVIWVARSWRGWAADFGTQAVRQGIASSDLPQQEKDEIMVQVDRVAKELREGRLSMEQAGKIIEKVLHSPLMPSLVVAAVEKQYFERSKLSDDEKKEGRVTLQRFARGVIDKKIEEQGIDAVMGHIADRQPNGGWQLRPQVSDDELRAALKEAKTRADAAGIPDQPEKFDPSDEFKRIIDEAINPPQAEAPAKSP